MTGKSGRLRRRSSGGKSIIRRPAEFYLQLVYRDKEFQSQLKARLVLLLVEVNLGSYKIRVLLWQRPNKIVALVILKSLIPHLEIFFCLLFLLPQNWLSSSFESNTGSTRFFSWYAFVSVELFCMIEI